MSSTLNEKEERALIAACLGIDIEYENVVDFVVIAHVHEKGKLCQGKIRFYTNCTKTAYSLVRSIYRRLSREVK